MANTIKPQGAREVYFTVPAAKAVDAEKGKITGCIIMEGDREATGHGLWIDADTLSTALASLPAGGKILAYLHHPNAKDYIAGNGTDRFEQSIGYFDNFAILDGQLKADLTFWDSFQDDPMYDKIMEIAATDACLVNISIEASGYAVNVCTDGREVTCMDGEMPAGEEFVRDIPSFRVTDLTGAALVSQGAATSSLFKAEALHVTFAALAPSVARETAKDNPSPEAKTEPAPAAPVDAGTYSMSLLKTLTAKYSADAARLARAVAIASETDKLSADEIETMLARQDELAAHEKLVELSKANETKVAELTSTLSARDAEIVTLKANHESAITALKAEHADALKVLTDKVTAAEASAAEFKDKFEKIKVSGTDPIVLGIPGAKVSEPDEFSALMDQYNGIADYAEKAKFYSEKLAPLFNKR